MTMDSPSFAIFANLPPELRAQIWQHAALPVIGPALCRYREGLWNLQYVEPGDKNYSTDLPNIYVDLRPDLAIDIPVELPLILVNHEARHVALQWAREHGIKISPQGNDYTCMRPFDPEQDIIYVGIDQIRDFYRELGGKMFEEVIGMARYTIRPKRLAISEMPFRDDEVDPCVFSLENYASHLYVIVGEQPDFEGLWEVDSSRGRSVIWNSEKQRFEMREGDFITDEGLYRVIEENTMYFSERLPEFAHLEVKPAFAVRR